MIRSNIFSFLYKYRYWHALFFVMHSWHFSVLFDMRYMIIRSMVADISSFLSKGHHTVSACNCREQTIFCRVLPLRNDHGFYILHSYMMPHFDANELLYAFVFHICGFDNHSWCGSCWNRSKVMVAMYTGASCPKVNRHNAGGHVHGWFAPNSKQACARWACTRILRARR